MAYKSKYKGKDVDNLLDKINKLEIPSLNGYATEQYVQQQLNGYATEQYVQQQLDDYATEQYVQQQLDDYATEQYVQQQLGNIDIILDSIIKD